MCPFMDRMQRLGGPWGPSRPAGACHDATLFCPRRPAAVPLSQPASSRSTSAGGRPRGSADNRHDATAGTAPASGTAVRPLACANRKNARSDVSQATPDDMDVHHRGR
jgi:hypothetical protein